MALSITKLRVLFMDGSEKIVSVSSADKMRAKRLAGKDAPFEEQMGMMLWLGACRDGLADPEVDWLDWHETVAVFDVAAEDDEKLGEDGATPAS